MNGYLYTYTSTHKIHIPRMGSYCVTYFVYFSHSWYIKNIIPCSIPLFNSIKLKVYFWKWLWIAVFVVRTKQSSRKSDEIKDKSGSKRYLPVTRETRRQLATMFFEEITKCWKKERIRSQERLGGGDIFPGCGKGKFTAFL